jgi:Ca-activated chloride channel family protein
LFNNQLYENSRGGGIGLLQVTGGVEAKEEQQLFVPLKDSVLRGEVTGPLGALTLVQTYAYSRDECDKVLQAAYRFPLPGDAAVTGVRVRFGDVEIATQLKERERAESEYQEAVQQGKQAALLSRESPDVFTLQVAGIRPDEPVVVETQYIQLARPRGETAGWTLRVPLTTAPRYVREDELGSRYAQGQPLAVLRDPGHRFALDLLLRGAGQVSSPTHPLDVSVEGEAEGQRVRLKEGRVIPDRDFVLDWTPRQQEDRPTLSVMLHDDPEAGYTYFLALAAPPAAHEPGSGVPREVILLVDHSGSMSGAKWEASDWAVNSFFSGLAGGDWFNLGLFHNTTKWFAGRPVQATDEQIASAAQYLDKNRDSGGTNLGVGLEQALSLPRAGGDELSRHVLIVTDAQVSDAGRIFGLADREARQSKRRRISVLCIDAAPNSYLANALADRGGGLSRFLTSNPAEEDITTALEDVLADWAEPVLAGLRLEVNRPDGLAAGREVLPSPQGATVIDLGDLPCGRAVWVAGRVPRAENEREIVFRLHTAERTIVTSRLDLESADASRPALKALFGARRVQGVEFAMNAGWAGDQLRDHLQRLGYDLERLQGAEPAVYAENARQRAGEALKDLLVRESLAYGLASAETSFVGVRSEAGQRIEGTAIVGSALPAGWSDDFLTMRGGALRSPGAGVAMAAMLAPDRSMGLVASAPPTPAPAGQVRSSPKALGRLLREKDTGRREHGPQEIYAGAPNLKQGPAVLLDKTASQEGVISRIEVRFKGRSSRAAQIDRGLVLLIYVGDLAQPRARIRLADLMRLGGARPLNLLVRPGDLLRVTLEDRNGAWAAGAPELVVKWTL